MTTQGPQRMSMAKRGCVALRLSLFAALGACAAQPVQSFFEREAQFLRLGVDLEQEEQAVRKVLAQRHLTVVGEVRGPGFLALSARTFEARLSAIRVVTGRGVVHAEDAALDDLFAPGSLRLLNELPASLGEYVVVGWARIPLGHDLGCATLLRVLPDGNVTHAILDASTFGPRACVAELYRAEDGRLMGTIAFPGLRSDRVPNILAELQFQQVPLGQPTPLVPVATIRGEGSWLEAERAHWQAALPGNAPFSDKHAVGVSRAAVALLSGQETSAQTAAYREAVGRISPGSAAAELVADTLAYIKRGWLDRTGPEGTLPEEVDPGDEIIEPTPAPELTPEALDAAPEADEDVQVIKPDAP